MTVDGPSADPPPASGAPVDDVSNPRTPDPASAPGNPDAPGGASVSVVYAGIDEAGFGPMLGPLCVAMSVFRVPVSGSVRAATDLWTTLASGVCRSPSDAKHRLAIDDSKRLKLPNDSTRRHPLTHLERGVLAFVSASTQSGALPRDDAALFESLRTRLEPHGWYEGPPMSLPLSGDVAALAIRANGLRSTLQRAGVEALGLRCTAVGESAFNDGCERLGSKAAVNFVTAAGLLRRLWTRFITPDAPASPERVIVAMDRHGGRTSYGRMLLSALPGAALVRAEESDGRSRYTLRSEARRTDDPSLDAHAGEMTIIIRPEGESAHLPVALASMTAKYARELAMLRFNRHFCSRLSGLAPTAGYVQDARRWLRDAEPVLSGDERRVLVRRS